MKKQSPEISGESKSAEDLHTQQVYDALVQDRFLINDQRKTVIKGLMSTQERTTAEQLWLNLSKKKKISISTVYNTLNILCRHGIAYKFYDEINQAFYCIDQTFFL